MVDAAKRVPEPMDVHVGSRVRGRRMLVGMSQMQLGEALGVTFQQVQKYEKGANRIGASRLQMIAEALTVEPSYFFDGGPASAPGHSDGARIAEGEAADRTVTFLSTPEGIRLNMAFSGIADEKVRRRVVDLVESLAGAA